MLKHSLRWLTGLGAAGVLIAASATPAVAAPTIEPYFQDATLAIGSEATIRGLLLHADEPTVLTDVSVRYDYRSLATKITVAPADGQECTAPEPGVLVCTERSDVVLYEMPPLGSGIYRNGAKRVHLGLTEDAQLGDSGDVAVSFQAAGGRRGSYTSRVRVGEGVDLAGGPYTSLSAKPGGKFTVPLVVANAGDKAVTGFVAVFDLPYSIRTKDRFSNCRYSGDHLVSCHFDEDIPVGTGLATTLNLEFVKDTYAPASHSGYAQFMTSADFEDLTRVRTAVGARAANPGSGPKLTMTEAPSRVRQADQTDVGPGNDYTAWIIRATGVNGTDLAAIGATLKGAAGTVVTATVGFRNNGPATLDGTNGDFEAATHTDVELPPGTTAVEVPDNCWLRQDTTRTYSCASEMLLVAGQTYAMKFRLRIDKVVSNARGAVRVNAPCECPGGEGFKDDIEPANDKATIVVNAAQGGGDQGDGDGDGGAGGGGSLPITGAPTNLIVGIGALLLVTGVGCYLLARRQGSRFPA
ncbi:LPXTG cell wall anchor domain-containing protein [Micromonospora sp. PSH03]|uniref:LPXTG cell wall anchor domain-containing protein n=1 Tax=Micromonospora TaxID=1873 RepID=UPI001B3905DD|nr:MULTISPECIES: LPXTG cell wall anchor domain-containing protein [Micromonospora]MBQ0990595.1 LPXTG cell wall anchor domain-containing protein [Micromonospora sp. H61]MCG5456683.1 LPXTG cell wall anchor domain-containing protein [Micromonospora salmantinae]